MTQRGLRDLLDGLGAKVDNALEELSLPAGVVDASGSLRWANAAARAALGDAAVGRPFFRLVDPVDARAVREDHLRFVLGPGRAPARTVVLVTSSGQRLRAELTGARLTSGAQVVGVFGVAHLEPLDVRRESPTTIRLTPRQTEILRLLAGGRSTEQIATELGITVATTRNHIRRLLRRLDVHSRVEAVARGHAIGLLGERGRPPETGRPE